YCPSFTVALRLLCLVRLFTAATATIPDCDEVYNYWEPTHYLQYGRGLQTWEYAPTYAIRSWAYIALHALVGTVPAIVSRNRLQVFYSIRFVLAIVCAACEAHFYTAVVEHFNRRIGRYLLVALMLSAGMAQASVGYLPSTFAMYTTMLAAAYFIRTPSIATRGPSRTMGAVLSLAAGAVLGWPFSGAVGLPFALEEAFSGGAQPLEHLPWRRWMPQRWRLLAKCIATATVVILIPVTLIDSLFYRRLAVVSWNIVRYNVLGGADRGPDLYGTEPWWFYLANGAINFNILWLLALGSLPLLVFTVLLDRSRFCANAVGITGPAAMLVIRLAPFYVWLSIFSLQAHKEERFLFPVYPLVCFNAAVALYLARGWIDRGLAVVRYPPASLHRRRLVACSTFGVLALSTLVSFSRIAGMYIYYRAPMEVYAHLVNVETPGRLASLAAANQTATPLRVCVGKEWYRFPSSYLLPENARLYFLRSHFRGLLPKYFTESQSTQDAALNTLPFGPPIEHASGWRPGTWSLPTGMNDLNIEEADRYVDADACDYIVDVDFPHRYAEDPQEPRYALHTQWEAVHCHPFLDAERSRRLSRALWLPGWLSAGGKEGDGRRWGNYCLLRRNAYTNKQNAPEPAEVSPERELPSGDGSQDQLLARDEL
ncbi:glycosyltransferase family 22 protein, partial [Thamnocephalis sphaerospora]